MNRNTNYKDDIVRMDMCHVKKNIAKTLQDNEM